MKRQYLGDSKDSFKWDYHDFLTAALGCTNLTLILMLTPDDHTRHGMTDPELSPARDAVISFCRELRKERNIHLLHGLPRVSGSSYLVDLHKPGIYYSRQNSSGYFFGLPVEGRRLFFLDPDNGFEPETRGNEKHVLYSDIVRILELMSEQSVISVFQHFRRIPFDNDFIRIKQRLAHDHVAAVYWHSLMFVTAAKTKKTIEEVIAANHEYSQRHPPVKVLQ